MSGKEENTMEFHQPIIIYLINQQLLFKTDYAMFISFLLERRKSRGGTVQKQETNDVYPKIKNLNSQRFNVSSSD